MPFVLIGIGYRDINEFSHILVNWNSMQLDFSCNLTSFTEINVCPNADS